VPGPVPSTMLSESSAAEVAPEEGQEEEGEAREQEEPGIDPTSGTRPTQPPSCPISLRLLQTNITTPAPTDRNPTTRKVSL